MKMRDVFKSLVLELASSAQPLKRPEILGPHAGEAVAFQDVAEFVFVEHVWPGAP